jgi:hypothetical protein
MKNLFTITESERERILNQHRKSTQRQYLDVLLEDEQGGNAGLTTTTTTVVQPVGNATLLDVQNILIGMGYQVSKNGKADGKLGPLTLNALATALKNPAVKPQGDGQQPGGQTGNVNITDIISKIPQVGPTIVDVITKSGVDLTKLTPEQILPKIKEIAGNMIEANPTILPMIKGEIEKVLKTTLPDIGNVPTIKGQEGETVPQSSVEIGPEEA